MPHRLKKYYPSKPKHDAVLTSYNIVCNAHKACSAFLKQFEDIRRYRKAKGTPTDTEQDLLRAMLAFACAGLDSMSKQLVRDVLPELVDRDEGAAAMFFQRTKKALYKDNVLNVELLLRSIMTAAPRNILMSDLVSELTSGCLQSVDELFRVAAYFNIASKDLAANPNDLKRIFHVRNQIAHEMDMDFTQRNRSRRPRARDVMIDDVNVIFSVAKVFLEKTDNKLNEPNKSVNAYVSHREDAV
jgi:hypothetical protein